MTTRLTPTATNALATALVALAVIAGLASFEALVSPPWLPVAVRAVLITALALIVSRTVIGGRRARVARATGMSVDDGGHRHLLPPLIGLLVAVGVLVMEFGRSYSDSGWTLEPESLERLAGLFGQSWEYLTASRPPLEADAPVVIVVVSGGLLVLLLGDLFASTFRLPLLSALAIIALWLPNLALAGGLPWETLAVGVLVIVLLLCLRPAGAGRRRPSNPLARRAARRRTLRTGATALAVTALSLAVTAASTGMTPLVEGWRAHFIHSGGSWTMHTDLDVAASLGPRSTATLFRYAVIGLDGTRLAQDVGPLRLLTMSEFDGRNWEPPRLLNHGEAGPLDLLGTQGVSPAVWRPDLPARQVVFALDALQERNLPLPLEPRTVAADGTWHYDHRRDVLTSPEPIGHGFSYSVTVIPRHLDPAWLRSRPLGLP
ncbi:MAG: DUF3488 domain-containing protein, partial [Promicromonosporaceae bacterium]|nr:DUF3488 domain-containing protein [Promicromonosporaceae bacterium]